MIVFGELAGRERVNEVLLAKQLGVSRTPLREALNGLVTENALYVMPRRGFFVCPLTVEDFMQVYTVRQILDPGALEQAGIPPLSTLEELERLNEALLLEDDVEACIQLDDVWHLKLLEHGSNQVLISLIQQMMSRTHRYELAYFRCCDGRRLANDDHQRIITALLEGDLFAACQALKANMTSGVSPIVEWLKNRGIAE